MTSEAIPIEPCSQDSQELTSDQSPTIVPQLMLEGSTEFKTYINSLVKEGEQKNAKSLCATCWCLLSYLQKLAHHPDHMKAVKTPSQFCSLEGFSTYAKEHGHAQQIDKAYYYEPIKTKPLPCMQVKKIKTSGSETESTEKIRISLDPSHLPNAIKKTCFKEISVQVLIIY